MGWLRRLEPRRWVRFVRQRPALAAIGATALTLIVAGGVIASTTPLRCGAPIRSLAPKGILRGCIEAGPVAARTSPSPTPTPFPTPAPTVFVPLPPPITPPNPPQGNPSSPTGPFPPFFGPSSTNPGGGTPTLALNCRLAVTAGPAGSGGFIVFPGGTFIADPLSSVSLPASAAVPPTFGYGQQFPGLSYDQPFRRWLPVARTQVSPDGSRYAYTGTDGIYVVSVATDTQVEFGEGKRWTLVSVQADGVYASEFNAAGLWQFPFSGTPRQITATGFWRGASSTAAFGTATSAVPQGVSNTILRLDLKTGTTSDWFTLPDTLSSVVGFDGHGNPILAVQYLNGSGNEILIASGPGKVQPIAASSFGSVVNIGGPPVADSHGIWFAGNSNVLGRFLAGVILYVPGSGLYWMASIGGQLAGGCY